MAFRAAYAHGVTFDGRAFGRRLAAARAWRGLEPKQVAAHLDVSTETINRWERGELERPPSKGQLRLASEILGQPEGWLADGVAPPWQSDPTGQNEPATDGGSVVLRELAELRRVIERFDRKLDVADLDGRLKLIEETLRRLALGVGSSAR